MNWQQLYTFLAVISGIVTFSAAIAWSEGNRTDTPRSWTIVFLALTAIFGSLAMGMTN